MGRRGGRPGRGGKGADGGRKAGGGQDRSKRWADVPSTNENFLNYYTAQEIVPAEEWDQFIQALKDPLPTTFRITSCREIAQPLNEMIKRVFVPFLTGIEHEGVPLSPPMQIPWYPDALAWQLNIQKSAIRKNEAFKRFQSFLVLETDAGNLSRQEAVSMIPPLLLDVQPHHYVLDMCAAPGSKSAQLLESLQALPRKAQVNPGLLIANDSDAKRCHLLVHQSLGRIPSAGMMVTNHDATQLPGLRLPGKFDQAADGRYQNEEDVVGGKKEDTSTRKFKALLFDRILADVPCSGDGTLRKNIGIWRDWTCGNGLGLHALQLRIALRGIALLKPGGRLVYSTCSMNPVENEAVVSAILDACPEMSLVAVPSELPALIRRPGLTTWKVLTNAMTPAPHPDDGPATAAGTEDKKGQKKIWAKTLWPNGKEAERGLDRCLRIYPHLQDTGAFFVAVLEKRKSEGEEEEEVEVKEEVKDEVKVEVKEGVKESAPVDPATKRTADERASSPVTGEPDAKRVKVEDPVVPISEAEAAVPEVAAPEADAAEIMSTLPIEITGGPNTGGKGTEFKEEPYIFLSPEDEQVKLCAEFFDLDPSFPVESLLVRNASGSPLRTIYFTSPIVRQLLLSNSYKRMRLTSCGVKIFVRQESSKDGTFRCKWRVMNEGLDILRPFMGPKRILTCTLETLKVLIQNLNVAIADIKDEAFQTRIAEMEPGSCVLELATVGKDIEFQQNLSLPFWKSKASVNLMVEKTDKSALSLRLYGVDITPHAKQPTTREKKAAAALLAAEGGVVAEEGSTTEAGEETEAPVEAGEAMEAVVATE
ncbi:multisite-specific tRNA:(cytosine-C5)-methyltransferase, partial [Phenoliferia sp. Uapishka_3]